MYASSVLAGVSVEGGSPPELTRIMFRSAIAPALSPVNHFASERINTSSSSLMMGSGDVLVGYSVKRRFDDSPCRIFALAIVVTLFWARKSLVPSARACASARVVGCATHARAVGSNCGFVASPAAVLYTWYAPFWRS